MPRAPARRRAAVLGGVGGAFGAREDVTMQIHVCLLALRTRRPVKMVYTREESFFGHVHRHPAACSTSTARTRTAGSCSCARGSCSTAARTRPVDRGLLERRVLRRRAVLVPNARLTAFVAYTNNPPCGAMRGFGAVQSRSRTRRRWTSSPPHWGWIRSSCGSATRWRRGTRSRPDRRSQRRRPSPSCSSACATCRSARRRRRVRPARAAGRRGNMTHGEGVRRGVGFAVGIKNVCFSEGFDDYSTARVRISADADGCWSRCTRPRSRSARASCPCRRRSRAPSWASSASSCERRTRPSARRVRRRRRDRRR